MKVTDVRTGEFITTATDSVYGIHSADTIYNINTGDVINLTAVNGVAVGYNEGIANREAGYLMLNVHISTDYIVPPIETIVSLSVCDTAGCLSYASQVITLNP